MGNIYTTSAVRQLRRGLTSVSQPQALPGTEEPVHIHEGRHPYRPRARQLLKNQTPRPPSRKAIFHVRVSLRSPRQYAGSWGSKRLLDRSGHVPQCCKR